MLPSRCIQEPCRNIEVMTFQALATRIGHTDQAVAHREFGAWWERRCQLGWDQAQIADRLGQRHPGARALDQDPRQHVERDEHHRDHRCSLSLVLVVIGEHRDARERSASAHQSDGEDPLWEHNTPREGVAACYDFRSCAPVAQLDRATGFEPVGRRFESCRAHLRIVHRESSMAIAHRRDGARSSAG